MSRWEEVEADDEVVAGSELLLPPSTGGVPGGANRALRLQRFPQGSLNVAIRSIVLAGRLGLTVLLARGLSAEDLGLYGVVAGAIAIGVILLGGEFYQFTFREIAGHGVELQRGRVKSQSMFHALVLLVTVPAALVILMLEGQAAGTAALAVLLLAAEHVCQEIVRLLITLQASLTANVVQLFRQVAWAVPLAALLFWRGQLGVTTVLAMWTAGTTVGCAIGLSRILRLWGGLGSEAAIDWEWMWAGVRFGLRFLLIIGPLTILPLLGRYLLYFLGDEAGAGRFTVLSTLTNPIQTLVETGVMSVVYPQLMASHNRGDIADVQRLRRKLRRHLVLSSAVIGLAIAAAAYMAQTWVLGSQFRGEFGATATLTLSSLVFVWSWLPKTDLFVAKRDRDLLLASLSSLAVAGVAGVLLVGRWGVMGAASTSLIGALTLLVTRQLFVLRVEGACPVREGRPG